jgi:hypothetical protein
MQSSSRTTLESLVDSLQQGLLDPSTNASTVGAARHAPSNTLQAAPSGSLVLTQHQVSHTEVSECDMILNYCSPI